MEKTLEILEKNVQWIVLGLSVLFLGWVAYAYVVTPPATQRIGNRAVVANTIDEAIHDTAVKPLDAEIARKDPVVFPAPDLVSPWRDHMQQPTGVALNSKPFDVLVPKHGVIDGPDLHAKVFITSLPKFEKADGISSVAGMSVIQIPPPAAVPGAAAGAPQNPGVNKDLLWISSFGTISGKSISEALKAPIKGQPFDPATFAQVYNTSLLEVTLQRQQATGYDIQGNPIWPQGAKGIETVAPLIIHVGDLQKIPAENVSVKDKYDFLTWAQANGPLIATPAFYQVVAGSAWQPPQNPANAPPGPATAPAGDPSTQPAGAPGAAPAAPAAAPAAPAAGAMKASAGAVRSNAFFAPFDPNQPPGSPFPLRPHMMEGGINPQMPFNPMAAGAGAAVPAQFDPFAPITDIQIWGHDDNVKAGQTYRYRFIYKMKNPVFAINNQAPPELVKIFSVSSPPSDWSKPVTVPETTKFWLAGMGKLEQPVKVDIFKWQNGAWTVKKNVPMLPGDTVPGTNVTIVDIRSADPRGQKDKYVLVVTDAGELKQRNLNDDVNNDEHQQMLTQTGGDIPLAPAGPLNVPQPRRPIRTQSLAPQVQ